MTTTALAMLVVFAVGWRCSPRVPSRRVAPRLRHRRTYRSLQPIIVVAATTLTLGPIAAAVVPAAWLIAQRWQRLHSRAAHRRAIERAYPDAIELLVLGVRAGALPAGAIHSMTPHLPDAVRPAFEAVLQGVARGERFADALESLELHLGHAARPLVDSLAAADRYGLPLAPVLDRLADDARANRRRAAETRARQLPVRLSLPLVLCTLPSFVLLAIVPLLLGALSSLSA